MQMTTREAVANLCQFVADTHSEAFHDDDRLCLSVKLLCEHYGFKLEQFFDVEEVE